MDELLSKFESIWKLATLMTDLQTDERTSETSETFTGETLFGEDAPEQVSSAPENTSRTFGGRTFELSSEDEQDAILPSDSSLTEDSGRNVLSRKRKRSRGVGKRSKRLPESVVVDFDDLSAEAGAGSLTLYEQQPDFQEETWEEELGLLTYDGEILSKSMTVSEKPPVKTCHICGENFSSLLDLAKHVKNRHRKSRKGRSNNNGRLSEGLDWGCPLCDDKFKVASALKKHTREKHRVSQRRNFKSRSSVSILASFFSYFVP